MGNKQIAEAAKKYSSKLDFSSADILNEKGKIRISEWAERDFIAGAEWRLNQKKLITFYSEDGKILGQTKLKQASTHKERCLMAESIGLDNWSHYEMRDSGIGMKKEREIPYKNFVGWYEIKDGLVCDKIV